MSWPPHAVEEVASEAWSKEGCDAASDVGSVADSTMSCKSTTRSARGSRDRFYNKNEAGGLCAVCSASSDSVP